MESRPSLKSPVTELVLLFVLSGCPSFPEFVQSVCWTNWCGDTGGTTGTAGSIFHLVGLNLQTQKCRFEKNRKPFLFLNKTII